MTQKTSYITGFVLSLALTFLAVGAYWLHHYTQHSFPSHEMLKVWFVMLAVAQLLVQLVCFLHIGQNKSNYWRVVTFGFTLFIVGVVMGGTLWIMSNLAHNMHSTRATFEEGKVDPAHEN